MAVENSWEIPSIGSDESGKGDFFGGPVVVAVRLDQKTLGQLRGDENRDLYARIRDSKQCSDEWIRDAAQRLMGICKYEALEYPPEIYNREYQCYRNMNSLLAHMHNAVHQRLEGNETRIVDAFTKESNYIQYLRDHGTEYVKIDIMCERADSRYLSVAIASIIARYMFMKQMDELTKMSKLGENIPYGCSYANGSPKNVVDMYDRMVEAGHDPRDLNLRFVKSNFSTLERVKNKAAN